MQIVVHHRLQHGHRKVPQVGSQTLHPQPGLYFKYFINVEYFFSQYLFFWISAFNFASLQGHYRVGFRKRLAKLTKALVLSFLFLEKKKNLPLQVFHYGQRAGTQRAGT
jgi:hypothetical protein